MKKVNCSIFFMHVSRLVITNRLTAKSSIHLCNIKEQHLPVWYQIPVVICVISKSSRFFVMVDTYRCDIKREAFTSVISKCITFLCDIKD